jgi:pyrimidine-nucleoside phosphorylase
LTDMNQPLGRAVGNSLEVQECIDLLRGDADEGAKPVLDLSLQLSAHMLILANVERSFDASLRRLQKVIASGHVMECLRRNIEAQGGDPKVCDSPKTVLPLVKEYTKVECTRSGFVSRIETTEIGHAVAAIGGGRIRIEDVIDPSVGFVAEVKLGDQVKAGDVIGLVYGSDSSKTLEAAARIRAAYQIDDVAPDQPELVKEIINE